MGAKKFKEGDVVKQCDKWGYTFGNDAKITGWEYGMYDNKITYNAEFIETGIKVSGKAGEFKKVKSTTGAPTPPPLPSTPAIPKPAIFAVGDAVQLWSATYKEGKAKLIVESISNEAEGSIPIYKLSNNSHVPHNFVFPFAGPDTVPVKTEDTTTTAPVVDVFAKPEGYAYKKGDILYHTGFKAQYKVVGYATSPTGKPAYSGELLSDIGHGMYKKGDIYPDLLETLSTFVSGTEVSDVEHKYKVGDKVHHAGFGDCIITALAPKYGGNVCYKATLPDGKEYTGPGGIYEGLISGYAAGYTPADAKTPKYKVGDTLIHKNNGEVTVTKVLDSYDDDDWEYSVESATTGKGFDILQSFITTKVEKTDSTDHKYKVGDLIKHKNITGTFEILSLGGSYEQCYTTKNIDSGQVQDFFSDHYILGYASTESPHKYKVGDKFSHAWKGDFEILSLEGLDTDGKPKYKAQPMSGGTYHIVLESNIDHLLEEKTEHKFKLGDTVTHNATGASTFTITKLSTNNSGKVTYSIKSTATMGITHDQIQEKKLTLVSEKPTQKYAVGDKVIHQSESTMQDPAIGTVLSYHWKNSEWSVKCSWKTSTDYAMEMDYPESVLKPAHAPFESPKFETGSYVKFGGMVGKVVSFAGNSYQIKIVNTEDVMFSNPEGLIQVPTPKFEVGDVAYPDADNDTLYIYKITKIIPKNDGTWCFEGKGQGYNGGTHPAGQFGSDKFSAHNSKTPQTAKQKAFAIEKGLYEEPTLVASGTGPWSDPGSNPLLDVKQAAEMMKGKFGAIKATKLDAYGLPITTTNVSNDFITALSGGSISTGAAWVKKDITNMTLEQLQVYQKQLEKIFKQIDAELIKVAEKIEKK